VTFVDGSKGLTGYVSASNSLVGSSPHDQVGLWGFQVGIVVLSTQNYLVISPQGNFLYGNPTADTVTFGSGTSGVRGVIIGTNSFVGPGPITSPITTDDFHKTFTVSFSQSSFVFVGSQLTGFPARI
jgi:hypothetical protein